MRSNKNTISKSRLVSNTALNLLLFFLIFSSNYSSAQNRNESSSNDQKSTVLAVALSLQPLPIDFGNFYAGNLDRAILYTAGELAVFIPTMTMISNGSNTSDADRTTIYALIGGYVLIKIISAFDAGIRIDLDNRTLINNNYLELTTLLSVNWML